MADEKKKVHEDEGDVAVEKRQNTEKPRQYKVILHNDNYTTRDFVVFLLMTVFGKGEPDAVRIMLHVHNNGIGVAGVYTYEVAETKVATVIELARQNEYPLMCTLEPE